jgi:hypothetical protein
MKRVLIDLPEHVHKAMTEQAAQHGRKLKPFLEYVLFIQAGHVQPPQVQPVKVQPAPAAPERKAVKVQPAPAAPERKAVKVQPAPAAPERKAVKVQPAPAAPERKPEQFTRDEITALKRLLSVIASDKNLQ